MDTLKDLDLVRAISPRPELVRAEGDEGMPTMNVDFSVFNSWYEIDSWFEGQFLERTVAGSFKKTIRENGSNVKVLFDHGMDYQIGNKVLGPIDVLREDPTGPHAEVPLLDTSYNRDLLPGLDAGLYGSSFRFRVIKEEWNDEPGTSDYNPKGLPERTIKEVRLMEFGPVTFPANPESTAGIRGLTDEYYGRVRSRNPQVYDELVARAQQLRVPAVPLGTGTKKDSTLIDREAVQAEIDRRAANEDPAEPVADHSGEPFRPTVGPKRIARTADLMGARLELALKGAQRHER